MSTGTLPAISTRPPFSWALAVAVTDLVTPWMVSWPGTERSTTEPLTVSGTLPEVAVKVAWGKLCTFRLRETTPSRRRTSRPATVSTLASPARPALKVMAFNA